MKFLDDIVVWLFGADVSLKDIEKVVHEREKHHDFCPRASKLFKIYLRLHKLNNHNNNLEDCVDCKAMQKMLELELKK